MAGSPKRSSTCSPNAPRRRGAGAKENEPKMRTTFGHDCRSCEGVRQLVLARVHVTGRSIIANWLQHLFCVCSREFSLPTRQPVVPWSERRRGSPPLSHLLDSLDHRERKERLLDAIEGTARGAKASPAQRQQVNFPSSELLTMTDRPARCCLSLPAPTPFSPQIDEAAAALEAVTPITDPFPSKAADALCAPPQPLVHLPPFTARPNADAEARDARNVMPRWELLYTTESAVHQISRCV